MTKKEIEKNYNIILNKVIKTIEESKYRAFTEINKALLYAYWSIGKELSKSSAYGKSVVERLSSDLRFKFPNSKGYSATNLWNMKRFYESYSKLQPVVREFKILYFLFPIHPNYNLPLPIKTLKNPYKHQKANKKLC